MRGLDKAADELRIVQGRVVRLHGMGRITRDDFDRLDAKFNDLHHDLHATTEQQSKADRVRR